MRTPEPLISDEPVWVDDTGFRVAALESGQARDDLPLWCTAETGSFRLDMDFGLTPTRADVADVPGAFQIIDLLSEQECRRFVKVAEQLGFTNDAPVSLGRNIRHNQSFTWLVDDNVDAAIWSRCADMFIGESFDGARPLGLNARFRFYRYETGDFFAPHTDGAWPGSRLIDGQPVMDAYGDRYSQTTMLIFLTDGYEGGRTVFHTGPDATVAVRTPKGAALCFPHGAHPLHCVHAGERIERGTKTIIRIDVLYG